ncbi:COG4315 family predicted lipoprotein [Paenibacillus ferrarius]|uniref:COG4315 family predicted lipoprotein n=1 Tax=Paenibacillus ferrarius TaxID=1469647 RepID=UPI003D2B5763
MCDGRRLGVWLVVLGMVLGGAATDVEAMANVPVGVTAAESTIAVGGGTTAPNGSASEAGAATEPLVVSETQLVLSLGLMQVAGEAAAYWASPEPRLEAALTLLRLQGLEAQARAFAGAATFADAGEVGAPEQPVLAYLKANPALGWSGVGGERFAPSAGLTAAQLEKLRLTVLGYREGEDFTFASVRSAARAASLSRAALWDGVSRRQFAAALVELLKQPVKGASDKLFETLVKTGRLDGALAARLRYKAVTLQPSDWLGAYLTDANGMALYARTSDGRMQSNCTGACVDDWPLFTAAGALLVPAELDAADFSVLARADGMRQMAYKGMPLYHFIRDFQPGDVKGEGIDGSYTVKAPATVKLLWAGAGGILTDGGGRTLYVNNLDPEGASVCAADCLQEHPLFYTAYTVASPGLKADDFGFITRDDGLRQVTFKGFPLYYSQHDGDAGDLNGQPADGGWLMVDPVSFNGTSVSHGLVEPKEEP